jgi:uncharacterized protein
MPSRATLPAERPALLIAAQSGRALAAAAHRAGYAALVADLFGDSDTIAIAARHRSLRGRFGQNIEAGTAIAALESLRGSWKGPVAGLILGSGFERSPRLIASLERRFPLVGASAETVARLKDPFGFAALAERLAIPHPPVERVARGARGLFLSKRRGGSGGGHIQVAEPGRWRPGRYVQKCVAGIAHSAAFLADGRRSQVVAFTEQFSAPSRRAPWRYGGAIEPGVVPARVRSEVEEAIGRIVAEVGLKGLASADFLLDGDKWWLLEINPRPGATLDILDRARTPLLERHVEACAGQLGTVEERPAEAAGSMILYATRSFEDAALPDWPDDVADRPPPGAGVKAGGPICTIRATGRDAAAVRAELDRRSGEILDSLLRRNRSRDWHRYATERQCPREAAR